MAGRKLFFAHSPRCLVAIEAVGLVLDVPTAILRSPKLLEQLLSEHESDKDKIVHFEEENAQLRQHLFGSKSEQTAAPTTPQMALFNEPENGPESVDETVKEEAVAPTKRRGKRSLCPPIFRASKSFTNCPITSGPVPAVAVNIVLARKSASSSRSCRCKST